MDHVRCESFGDAGHLAVPVENPGRSKPSFVEALIDPVSVFGDPFEVVDHPRFADEEKRTILLSWARDELVVEQVARNVMPDLKPKSRINAVIEALARFDRAAADEYRSAVACVREGLPRSRVRVRAAATSSS